MCENHKKINIFVSYHILTKKNERYTIATNKSILLAGIKITARGGKYNGKQKISKSIE